MTEYRFNPDMEECVKEVLMQAKEVYRLAHEKNVMLTPISVRDLLAEATRLLTIKKAGEVIKRSVELDKLRDREVPSGYPDTLQ